MAETYPYIVPTGVNIYPAQNGTGSIGTPTSSFQTGYMQSLVLNGVQVPQPVTLPTYAWLSSSGNVNYPGGGTASYAIMSGLLFQSGVGANFTVTAGNPHRVTYIGSAPIYAKIDVNGSQFYNVNIDVRVAIIKNGITSFSGNAPFMQGVTGGGAGFFNVNQILLINSGDYFQAGVWASNQGTSQFVNSTFQIAIIKLVY